MSPQPEPATPRPLCAKEGHVFLPILPETARCLKGQMTEATCIACKLIFKVKVDQLPIWKGPYG